MTLEHIETISQSPNATTTKLQTLLSDFQSELEPLEKPVEETVLTDHRTEARFFECHVRASKLIKMGTTDVPLDPISQPDYRANRELLSDEAAFIRMKDDALKRRAFSNIVIEYTKEFNPEKPMKIIGGQHRFEAIKNALGSNIDEFHGVKVYFALTKAQRIDVQLISNTNLAISGALVDRLKETFRGPNLRVWCQQVGLLKPNQDFGDTHSSGGAITVHIARTFIANFFIGKTLSINDFSQTETTPILYRGGNDKDEVNWEDILATYSSLWTDNKLRKAGEEFARLATKQRTAFPVKKGIPRDWPEKAMNGAVLAAWAFTAGLLQNNPVRLDRHFKLVDVTTPDPLNAKALANGRHKTDSSSYRGLGYRTDARERAQLVELFYIIAEDGDRINDKNVKSAIYAWFAKKAVLDAKKQREK